MSGLSATLGQFPSHLADFQIMTWSKDDNDPVVPLDPSDIRYSIVAAGVHFGLRLLEEKTGRAAMNKLGIEFVKHFIQENGSAHWQSHPLVRDMDILVDYYLAKMRSGFCNLIIAPQDGSYACFLVQRSRARGPDYKYTQPADLDADYYNPKDIGAVLIDDGTGSPLSEILRAYAWIKEHPDPSIQTTHNALRQFRLEQLHLSKTIAHELGHVFHSFLSNMHGNRLRTHTPAHISITSEPGVPRKAWEDKYGEAGRVLEWHAWGGFLKSSGVPGITDHDFDDYFFSFNWSRFELETWVEEKKKIRVIPDEMVQKVFFEDPRGFSLKGALEAETALEDPPIEPASSPVEEGASPASISRASIKSKGSDCSACTGDGDEKLWKLVGDEQMEAYRAAPMVLISDGEAFYAFVRDPQNLIPVQAN